MFVKSLLGQALCWAPGSGLRWDSVVNETDEMLSVMELTF